MSAALATPGSPSRRRRPPRGVQPISKASQALVRSMAFRLARKVGHRISVDDLIQSGYVGLIEAAQVYDPFQGLSFVSFAYHRVLGAMQDSVRLDTGGARAHEAEELFAGGRIPSRACDPTAAIETGLDVKRAIRRLPAQQRKLVEDVSLADRELGESGAEMGVKKSWACRLHAQAKATLAIELAEVWF